MDEDKRETTEQEIVGVSTGSFEPLTADAERRAKDEYLQQIKQFTSKANLQPEDFHVRGMRIVNSQRDYYYSRFTLPALNEVAELMPGAPVMIGHDYRNMPIGTFFAAHRVFRPAKLRAPRKDSYWVEALFYVPNDDEGNSIIRRIDLGTWREVSLGWRFTTANCGICGESIRECPHLPGEIYEEGIAEFEMSGIVDVLEGSMVFRGGQKGTHLFNPGQRALAAVEEQYPNIVTAASLLQDKYEKRAGGMFGPMPKPGLRSSVQSVIASRLRFDTPAEASSWVRSHSFRADTPSNDGEGYRFEQFALKDDQELRRIKLEDGIFALVAKSSKKDTERVMPEGDAQSRSEESAPAVSNDWFLGI
jgi:hypothetical protein